MVSTPKPPNPYQTAAAQQGAEQGAAMTSAIMNNPNRYNPWGSQTYNVAGYETVYDAAGRPQKVPRYNEVTKLSPDQMKLYGLQTQTGYNLGNAAVQQSAKLGNYLNQNVGTEGLEAWNRGQAPGEVRQDQGPTDRAAIEAAMMGRWNQDAARQASAQDTQLAARGLSPGSAQYGQVQQGRDRARTDAVNQAYLASGQESRAAQGAFNQAGLQRYQMGQDYAGFLNNLRNAQLGERMQLRNQPINEIIALMSGMQLQNPQYPGFTGQGINAPNVAGLIGQSYGADAQNAANMNQGLFGIGQAFMGLPFA